MSGNNSNQSIKKTEKEINDVLDRVFKKYADKYYLNDDEKK